MLRIMDLALPPALIIALLAGCPPPIKFLARSRLAFGLSDVLSTPLAFNTSTTLVLNARFHSKT